MAPMAKEPMIFTKSVGSGKSNGNKLATPITIRYRSTAPIAPPIAIHRIWFMVAS
jgi:hypothetical protein